MRRHPVNLWLRPSRAVCYAAALGLVALTSTACEQDFGVADKPEDVPIGGVPDTDEPTPQPNITFTPASLDFGYLPINCPGDGQVMVIGNDGEADLEISDISLAGAEAVMYTITAPAGVTTLAPGETVEVTVDFLPTIYDTFDEARIKVTSNDPDEGVKRADLLGHGAEDATWDELFTQELQNSVDVLWLIDKSGSMSGEVSALAGQFSTFITNFDALGLDYQIAVTTTDPNFGQFQGAIITPQTGDPVGAFSSVTSAGGGGGEAGLDAAHTALTPPQINDMSVPYPANTFIRDDANLALVVVSDEDDQSSMNPPAFSSWLDSLKPDPSQTSFSGITGPPTGGSGGIFNLGTACNSLATGVDATYAPRYGEAITATGGIHGNICTMEFDVFLNFLSYVAAGLRYEFELAYEPTLLPAIIVSVGGVEIPYDPFNGWTYDEENNSIIFHGDEIPEPGASISVTYPFETVCE